MKTKYTSLAGLLAIGAILCGSSSYGSVVDLGAASQFTVLTFNTSNVSDSAFNGESIGVVNGNWVQSGGGQTNNQQPTTVYLSQGFANKSGLSNEATVFNTLLLNQAWSNAQTASANLAALTPTQTIGAITTSQTISESAVGNYVLSISSIDLNQGALTLSAPAGSTFVLNISGNITLNGGSQGNGILLAGGLTESDVVYNLTGANSTIMTSGGMNSNVIQGIVLATGANASVNLHPGEVDGAVIATTYTSSSGSLLITPVPEANTGYVLAPILLGVLFLFSKNIFGAKARQEDAVLCEMAA